MPRWQRGLMVSWAALGVFPAGQGGDPSPQHWRGHTWSTGSRSGLPRTKKDTELLESPAKGH